MPNFILFLHLTLRMMRVTPGTLSAKIEKVLGKPECVSPSLTLGAGRTPFPVPPHSLTAASVDLITDAENLCPAVPCLATLGKLTPDILSP